MIYVVSVSGGEYEDQWTRGLVATHDKEKAEAHKAQLEAEQAHLIANADKLHVQFQEWFAEHPMPPRPKFTLHGSFNKASDKQKEKIKEIQKANALLNAEWNRVQGEWVYEAQAYIDKLRAELKIVPELPWYSLIAVGGIAVGQLHYEIEELPELT